MEVVAPGGKGKKKLSGEGKNWVSQKRKGERLQFRSGFDILNDKITEIVRQPEGVNMDHRKKIVEACPRLVISAMARRASANFPYQREIMQVSDAVISNLEIKARQILDPTSFAVFIQNLRSARTGLKPRHHTISLTKLDEGAISGVKELVKYYYQQKRPEEEKAHIIRYKRKLGKTAVELFTDSVQQRSQELSAFEHADMYCMEVAEVNKSGIPRLDKVPKGAKCRCAEFGAKQKNHKGAFSINGHYAGYVNFDDFICPLKFNEKWGTRVKKVSWTVKCRFAPSHEEMKGQTAEALKKLVRKGFFGKGEKLGRGDEEWIEEVATRISKDWRFNRQPTVNEVSDFILDGIAAGLWFDLTDKGRGTAYMCCPVIAQQVSKVHLEAAYEMVKQCKEGNSLDNRFKHFFDLARHVKTNIGRPASKKHHRGFLKVYLKRKFFTKNALGNGFRELLIPWSSVKYRPITSYRRHYLRPLFRMAGRVLSHIQNTGRSIECFVQEVDRMNTERAERVRNWIQYDGLTMVEAMNRLPDIQVETADADNYFTCADKREAERETLRVVRMMQNQGYKYAFGQDVGHELTERSETKKPEFGVNKTDLPVDIKRVKTWKPKAKRTMTFTRSIPKQKGRYIRLEDVFQLVVVDLGHTIVRFGNNAYVQICGAPMGSPLSNNIAYSSSARAIRGRKPDPHRLLSYEFVDDVISVSEKRRDRWGRPVERNGIECYYGPTVQFSQTGGEEYIGIQLTVVGGKFLSCGPIFQRVRASVPTNVPKRVMRSIQKGEEARKRNQTLNANSYIQWIRRAKRRQ